MKIATLLSAISLIVFSCVHETSGKNKKLKENKLDTTNYTNKVSFDFTARKIATLSH